MRHHQIGNIDLKPCPFCGVKVSLTYHSADNTYNFWHTGVNSCAAKDPIEFDGDMVKSLKEAAEGGKLWRLKI